MLIRTVVAPVLGANCYVVSDDDGGCVVIDPGAGVLDEVLSLVRGDGLRAAGVLLTHGHVDHTWDAAALSEALAAPVWVHRDDAYRLSDPFGSLGPLGAPLAQMGAAAGMVHKVPADVSTFSTGVGEGSAVKKSRGGGGGADEISLSLTVVGRDRPFVLGALHAPGHTQGSTVYLVEVDGVPTAFTGDVLFAGSVGRTDLPGGDPTLMQRTLERLRDLEGRTVVHPGHGRSSRLSTELLTNPFLV